MSETIVDYDDICEAVGTRIQDGDHIVAQAVESLAKCKSTDHAMKKAVQERARCVREEKFLAALIYDTIINRLEALDEG